MLTVKTEYLGNLRTKATHAASGTKIITDAPTDNHGRGEAFSPTDLVSASLGSCMMTIMGIIADREKLDLTGTKIDITKIMAAAPRKIQTIKIHFTVQAPGASAAQQQKLINAARTCPVALSLHPDIIQEVDFTFLQNPVNA